MKHRLVRFAAHFLCVSCVLGGCSQEVTSESAQREAGGSSTPGIGVTLPLLRNNDKKLSDLRKLVLKFSELREQEWSSSSPEQKGAVLANPIKGGLQVWLLRLSESEPVRPPRIWTVHEERRPIWGVLTHAVSWSIVELGDAKDSQPNLQCYLEFYTRGSLKAIYASLLSQRRRIGEAGFDASTLFTRRDFLVWANTHALKVCSAGLKAAETTRLKEAMEEFRKALREGKAISSQGQLDDEVLGDLKESITAALPDPSEVWAALKP